MTFLKTNSFPNFHNFTPLCYYVTVLMSLSSATPPLPLGGLCQAGMWNLTGELKRRRVNGRSRTLVNYYLHMKSLNELAWQNYESIHQD